MDPGLVYFSNLPGFWTLKHAQASLAILGYKRAKCHALTWCPWQPADLQCLLQEHGVGCASPALHVPCMPLCVIARAALPHVGKIQVQFGGWLCKDAVPKCREKQGLTMAIKLCLMPLSNSTWVYLGMS